MQPKTLKQLFFFMDLQWHNRFKNLYSSMEKFSVKGHQNSQLQHSFYFILISLPTYKMPYICRAHTSSCNVPRSTWWYLTLLFFWDLLILWLDTYGGNGKIKVWQHIQFCIFLFLWVPESYAQLRYSLTSPNSELDCLLFFFFNLKVCLSFSLSSTKM